MMTEYCEYAEAIGLLRVLFETYDESAGLFYDMLEESTTTHRWVVFSLDAYCAEREGDVIDGTAEGFDLGVIGEGRTPLEAVKDALAGVQARKKPRRRPQGHIQDAKVFDRALTDDEVRIESGGES